RIPTGGWQRRSEHLRRGVVPAVPNGHSDMAMMADRRLLQFARTDSECQYSADASDENLGRAPRKLEGLEDVGLEDLGLARELNAGFLHPGPERLTEGVELLSGLPDLADSNVVLVSEAHMKATALRGPVTRLDEGAPDGVVLLLRHVRGRKTDDDAHSAPP